MHVCQLIKGLGRGGAESLLPQVIRHRGPGVSHAVGYFLPWKDALVEEVRSAGAAVRLFVAGNPAVMLARTGAVAAWLRRERADLLHCHLPLAGVVGRLAGWLAGVPVVYTEHNLQRRYHPATRIANRLTWRLQRAAVAVSGEVAESIARHLPSAVPVHRVRNGIEIPPPPEPGRVAELRHRLDLPDGAPVVGTVAVMRVQKRLDLWLDAATHLLESHSDTRFVLVGDGPLRSELEERASRPPLAGRVRFTGLQEDVWPYLALLDLYLMSSQFEGLPLALLEAMASGLPPVVTAVGGIPEVVEDGVNGHLVRFGDPAALAASAAAVLEDPALARRLGEAARDRVRERFGIERMTRELEAIYRQIVGGGTGA